MYGTTHRLTPWRTDWSSPDRRQPARHPARQQPRRARLPLVREGTGEVMVCNRPTGAAELQRRAVERTGDGGLLAVDGASRGNLFSGGAENSRPRAVGRARRRGRREPFPRRATSPTSPTRPTPSAPPCPSSPRSCGRSASRPGPGCAGSGPRVARGGLYPFIRAFATVVERDVVVAAVIGDMLAGRTAVYADLVAYDEVAHHSGPRSRDAAEGAAPPRPFPRADREGRRARPARRTASSLLSDHGQSPGEDLPRPPTG